MVWRRPLLLAEFIGKTVLLCLGDNIFFGSNMDELLRSNKNPEGELFCLSRFGSERYGVVEFDKDFNALEEEPLEPKSNFAVPGLLFQL
jgi:glucose-1-phosphate thymidylyltransferase